jgi:hypothetical protein
VLVAHAPFLGGEPVRILAAHQTAPDGRWRRMAELDPVGRLPQPPRQAQFKCSGYVPLSDIRR